MPDCSHCTALPYFSVQLGCVYKFVNVPIVQCLYDFVKVPIVQHIQIVQLQWPGN